MEAHTLKGKTEVQGSEHSRCGWKDIPLEIGDHILSFVVHPHQKRNDPGLLMEVVLSSVCHTWKERKPFWQFTPPETLKIRLSEEYSPKKERILTPLAATLGSLPLLKWLKEMNCPWDAFTSSCAAQGGHFEVLKWLRENGCPWNEDTCSNGSGVNTVLLF
jgi:hypothetical protein